MYVYIVLVGVAAYGIFADRARAKQIRNYSRDTGLSYMGAAVPLSFPWGKSSMRSARSIANAVVGARSQKELVICDFTLGRGRARFSQTAVAVRGSDAFLWAQRFDPSLKAEQVDDWTLVYRPKELLAVKEIEALLQSVDRER